MTPCSRLYQRKVSTATGEYNRNEQTKEANVNIFRIQCEFANVLYSSYSRLIPETARQTGPRISEIIDDILLMIFNQATFGDVRNALRLSQVCQKWRQMTKQYPLLWSTISDDTEGGWKIGYEFFNLCLYLSRSADININLSFWRRWNPLHDTGGILDLLALHAHKVAFLKINTTAEDLFYFLAHKPQLDARRIKSWIWETGRPADYRSARYHMVPRSVDISPLCSLEFSDIRDLGFSWVAPPTESTIWNNKRSIYLDQIPRRNVDDYMDIFTRSTDLEGFYLRSVVIPGAYKPKSSQISMNNLRRLDLMDIPFEGLVYFLDSVYMPNLNHFGTRPTPPRMDGATILSLLKYRPNVTSVFGHIISLEIVSSGLGYTGEVFSGQSTDGSYSAWISVLYHEEELDLPLRTQILHLFPNLQDLRFKHGIKFKHWEGMKAPNVKCLSIVSGTWGFGGLQDMVREECFPRLNRLKIIDCDLVGDYALSYLEGVLNTETQGCVLEIQNVEGISRKAASEHCTTFGLELVWKEVEKQRKYLYPSPPS